MLLKPFVMNRYGRLVFPCNFFPDLNFSVFQNLEQFSAVIRRDFGEKAPTENDIVSRVQAGKYKSRYDICRDLALNLFWVNRFVLTMYEKRPVRWGDLPRHRDDIFLPVYKPRDSTTLATAIEKGYNELPASWDQETEDKSFHLLLDVFRNKQSAGGETRPIRPTVAEVVSDPSNLTCHLLSYDPDYHDYNYDAIVDCIHTVPELESLMRQAMILHNQYLWSPANCKLTEVGKLKDEDYVIAFHPRNSEVSQFIRRVKQNGNGYHRPRPARPETLALSEPEKPCPPVVVREQFTVMPRVEAIAVYKGEIACTNADLISNHAYCWSHMTAAGPKERVAITIW